MVFTLFSKPKTHKGKQFLEERAPKLIENPKKVMFISGNKTSEIVVRAMTDLVSWKLIRFVSCMVLPTSVYVKETTSHYV